MSARIIGAPVDRVDGRLKVTGGARYAAENRLPETAHAALVLSTIPKGRVTEIDVRRARSAPGVLSIVTHRNAPKLKPVAAGEFPLLLQDDRIHFNGQPLAVVVADTLERAKYAASLVRVRYERQPAITTMEAGLQAEGCLPNVARCHEREQTSAPTKANDDEVFAPRAIDMQPPDSTRGNPAQGLATAAARVEQTYTTPTENHNPIEQHVGIAEWRGNRLTVYTATQGVNGARQSIATAFAMPPELVRVVSRFLGGGFGSKGRAWWPCLILAVIAARQVGRPVKLELTREQMFTNTGRRQRTIQQVALGADAAGLLTALTHRTTAEGSMIGNHSDPHGFASRMLYSCPNVAVSHRLVRVNAHEACPMRSPGEATGTFALESAMDELAYALGLDPIELRIRNHADTNPHTNQPWSSKSLRECYRTGAQVFGWARRNPQPRSMRDGRYLVGMGMATSTYPVYMMPAKARAQLTADGRALIQSATHEIGTGAQTVMTQVAADALGLPVSRITFELGDTVLPEAPMSVGSMTTASVAPAVHAAARALRNKVIAMALADVRSPFYSATANDIGVEGGRLFSKRDPSKSETYAQILARNGGRRVEANGEAAPSDEATKRYSSHAFGAHFAEVRVDPDVCQLRVTRFVGVYGAGRIVNEKTARSQQIGGIMFGIGMALMEETTRDGRSGRIINANLGEYHVPTNADAPDIEVLFVEEDDSHVNALGIKGIGMLGNVGTAAAIANAVYHATGKRIRDLPITLDKLL